MQKNDKAYAFLFSRSTANRIYIKRFSIPRNYVHVAAIALFSVVGLSSLAVGVSGVVANTDFSSFGKSAVTTQMAALPAPAQEMQQAPEVQPNPADSIDYSRPAPATDYALNSGGPEDDAESDGENNTLEDQLRAIRTSSPPTNLPTMWSHLGKINNEFGFRRNPFGGRSYEFHPGMDIDGERGDMVLASANGKVIKAGWTGGYGNMVEIDHGNGLVTRYGHMSKLEIADGDTVTRGQLIGLVGSTGRSTGPHLHFELRLNDRPINPRHFLPLEPAELPTTTK